MNRSKQWSVGIAALAALALAAPLASAADAAQHAAKLHAKVTEADARATALAQVPGGTIRSAELENELGKLVWSFDIADAKSPNVVEVWVDAKTGRIASKKLESPKEQAREAKADKNAKP